MRMAWFLFHNTQSTLVLHYSQKTSKVFKY
uniref:Uncharacterized protein n=1 Tax=Lepeophtheirus salmonis TaxID=72036 RepID=A0A0K2V1D7_LEPSM